ncbi:TFIIB-type zinc ribbon-containing protein [Natronorubrum sp. JWXQ-INN-674]|uniref:TFIIB-type zinc ribbon-containing protein n=1 Tax=Natronorubrum halalkaliphilum TaxID=2691917 RepID=A0A6B0VR26_9EURY|nr:TFIIB-type zinc ribbon-containing protein [Natronorubrum halalkaliphilum]MXV64261.1 TFIIB-type zinc ribbon-containing protein [Natronorubrum halalkaliphilum]
MKIRGERECTECGTRWSYYETGSVGCPACGSLRSVGIDERTEHTDLQVGFDLTPVRNEIDEASLDTIAERTREKCREYIRRRGFINAGTLRELDDTYLAAGELLHVSDIIARDILLEEREELYFLSLLRDADASESSEPKGSDGSQRPPAAEIPPSLRGARGLAYANAVREYRRDIRTWAEDRDLTSAERSALETLGEHVKRIRMLDGDVEPQLADRLVAATRDLANGLRGDELALTQAQDRLESLEFGGVE